METETTLRNTFSIVSPITIATPNSTTAPKRKILTIEEKVRIIKDIDNGRKKSDLCRELCMASSTVSSILKSRSKILNAFKNNSYNLKRLRKPLRSDVDEALSEWFVFQRNSNVIVNMRLLRTKAEELAKQFGHEENVCSGGWLDRFKTRHNIYLGKNGELRDEPMKLPESLHVELREDEDDDEKIMGEITYTESIPEEFNENNHEQPEEHIVQPLIHIKLEPATSNSSPKRVPETSDTYNEPQPKRRKSSENIEESKNCRRFEDNRQHFNDNRHFDGKRQHFDDNRQLYEDEFSLFGKSVAAQLRQLSLSRALTSQARIQILLSEERVKDLAENSLHK